MGVSSAERMLASYRTRKSSSCDTPWLSHSRKRSAPLVGYSHGRGAEKRIATAHSLFSLRVQLVPRPLRKPLFQPGDQSKYPVARIPLGRALVETQMMNPLDVRS